VIDLGQEIRILIGGAAEHDAIHMLEMALGLVEADDATVDDDGQLRARGFEAIDARIVERRDLAVLFR
jgi:hypothetical protein